MDRWKPVEGFFQGTASGGPSGKGFRRDGDLGASSHRVFVSCMESGQRVEQEAKVSSNARKVQKADREKLRRDRLNEQFVELGHTLDPDRPKNDKATILADAVQTLKDLTSQVHRLKAEHTSLSEESKELTQEKNELREEKASIKSEIDNLNAQHQQRLGCLYPWATVPYPFSMPPLPFPSIPPYPFFQNQIPSTSSHRPFVARNPFVSSRHRAVAQPEARSRSLDQRSADYSDVVTELELKMPGSAAPDDSKTPPNEQCSSAEGKKGDRHDGGPPELPLSSGDSSGGGSVADS